MHLDTPVIHLNKVGEALNKRLLRLGIKTARDLLFHFPFRYEDFSQVAGISQLQDGQETTIEGTIELIANKRSPRKRTMITEAVVTDGHAQMRVVWFGQPFIAKSLHVGDRVFLSGKVKDDMFGLQMVGPSYEKIKETPPHPSNSAGRLPLAGEEPLHTARIVPMYPLTMGLTQKQLRMLIKQVLPVAKELEEWLPEDIQDRVNVMPLHEALAHIHFPEDMDSLRHAERRLKFDELFLLQLRAEMIRQEVKRETAFDIPFAEEAIKTFVDGLSFTLTKAQKIAAWEILKDIEKTEPMNRLLEGDVGSGKTVVAAMATLDAIHAGFQVAIMAPTEILAKQHFASFQKLLPDAKILLITSGEIGNWKLDIGESSKKKRRDTALTYMKGGEAQVVIGTHALLTDDVLFNNLGLVVVDEQHRFGVEQRKTIRAKSGTPDTMPHFLSMTATPIPRSFALTLYGDLDLSIINEMPVGRKPVETKRIEPNKREQAYGFIREQVKGGRQVFVICPLIEDASDKKQDTNNFKFSGNTDALVQISNFKNSDRKSVIAEYEKLSQDIFPDLRVAYIHGKMKPAEKDETMKKFAHGDIDILVSTSVVEVGVNIPNASVMMIEGAEHFGLAQLHQFRGRVGRSEYQSYCFLFTDSDSWRVAERLKFFSSTTDGFKVAEYDLEMRGPGEVYGKMQSGMGELKFATMQDGELIKLARDVARGIDFEKYTSLKEKVEEWERRVHLE
ncbi:MAG: DNA helicase RecG [Candidatus Magasanikbacteria bacterium CG_4_9_14_0_2_um_filter_42_11]|uniref:ATP-dependent DNA helicase RecG n=1 Tax=Candidatus Magasanikbacteria bacterium CG_4_9_14_0_2_um_filter_42_11 TaxID=1974643 RepID=A0A2M8FB83_9BACT|nr:MAG: DNA helicase RecG [Candidatus Magasanikbacteria bacterium CG10_big_fil_rev_8_21_14_0_10_43_9]PIY92053.1 MAG: DNA helicase RecG [Candidatus Magasanikbacteria bacterium CG_4_10_14_0_8_um_filter_42_12]PJC52972.1 MAG: DNA helicase RecG [Candidatus Magasanikbacteria bacterium CG_4_9_14_0_2_um_filter_42_11]